MNYEQKYKEALNKIKPLYEQAKRDGNPIWSTYEYLMPELTESEDERIRKALIPVVDRLLGTINFPFTEEQVLNWFEKQKEQKPISFNIPYNPDDYEVIMEGDATSVKLKEQKPIGDKVFEEWIDGWYNEYHRNGYITMNKREFKNFCRGIRNMYQQKPAEWSEEDERMLSRCVKSIESSKQFADSDTFNKAKDREIDWLENRFKSLLPQSKQEWSEEDEKMNKEIRLYLKQDRTDFPGRAERINKMIEWLINICPNSQWKPSEEQMKILNWAANGMVDKSIAAPEMRAVLRELYEQLKKLM